MPLKQVRWWSTPARINDLAEFATPLLVLTI